MGTIRKPSKRWLIVFAVLIVMVGGAVMFLAHAVKDARHSAELSCAHSRLYAMRLALQNYEQIYGTLPPLCLRDKQGKPIHSWRAIISPLLPNVSIKQLDLSQPWDSDDNRKIIDSIPVMDWNCFARGSACDQITTGTHLLALIGPNSLWDETTGLPKGKFREYPNSIMLVSVPEAHIKPFQPGDITEDEVRKLVEDGQEVLFIKAGLGSLYGIVTIEDGKLTFRTWEEERDRKGETP